MPDDKPDSPEKVRPQRPPTPLEARLTPEQLTKMEQWFDQKVTAVKSSMSGWKVKRDIYAATMEEDFSWRGRGYLGRRGANYEDSVNNQWIHKYGDDATADIFDLSNESLNVIGGTCEFFHARSVDDIFGTEPVFAAAPEIADGLHTEEADTIQHFLDFKLRESAWRSATIEALRSSYFLGEGIKKKRWKREIDTYETSVDVLHDKDPQEGGQPILTTAGEMIHSTDLLSSTEDTQPHPETGEPVTTVKHFAAKDPAIEVTGAIIAKTLITKTRVRYVGLDDVVMNHGDFLCATTFATLDEADFVGHQFDWPVAKVIEEFQPDPEIEQLLRTGANDQPKSEEQQPVTNRGETAEQKMPTTGNLLAMVNCVEGYFRYEPFDDGTLKRCYGIYCTTISRMIVSNYTANVTPEGQLPFNIIRHNPVKNRWYGFGYLEQLSSIQNYIDRTYNQISVRNELAANPCGGTDETALMDQGAERDGEFKLRPGKFEKMAAGKKMQDFLSFVEVPEMDKNSWELLNYVTDRVDQRTGATKAAKGEVSAMPSGATATAFEGAMQQAAMLAKLPIYHLRQSIEKDLEYAAMLICSNLDTDEVFQYFDGDQMKTEIMKVEAIRDLKIHIRLLMTRFRQREMRESAELAIKDAMTYLQVPEPEKAPMRILFIQAIKGLGFDNADAIIRPPIQQAPTVLGPDGQPVQSQSQPGNISPMTQGPQAMPPAVLPQNGAAA